jgi:hypothetical protein
MNEAPLSATIARVPEASPLIGDNSTLTIKGMEAADPDWLWNRSQ